MDSVAIKLEGLSKGFDSRPVLKNLNLEIPTGSLSAVIGRNGVGKSTLLRILVQQERIGAGKVWVLGHDVDVDDGNYNAEVGFVTESFNISLPLELGSFIHSYSLAFARWDQAIFDELMNTLQISLHRQFHTLSRGQKMQVAFAAAMAKQPKLLLLDEITSVLDPNVRELIMNRLDVFVKKGGTVILATNIISEAQEHSTHVLYLQNGEINLFVPKAKLIENHVRLRKPAGQSHPAFDDKRCVEIGMRKTGEITYVTPAKVCAELQIPKEFLSAEPLQIEEMFLFLSRSQLE